MLHLASPGLPRPLRPLRLSASAPPLLAASDTCGRRKPSQPPGGERESRQRHGDLHMERAPPPHPGSLPRHPASPTHCREPGPRPLHFRLPPPPPPPRAPAPAAGLHLRAGAGPRGRLCAALPRRRRGGGRRRRRHLVLRGRHLGGRLGAPLAPQGPHRGLPRRARRVHHLHPLHAALLR